MPREYGTPIGIAGGPSEKPSSATDRPKPRAPSSERVKAEMSRLWKSSSAVRERVRGSSAIPKKRQESMPFLDRIIDEQSK